MVVRQWVSIGVVYGLGVLAFVSFGSMGPLAKDFGGAVQVSTESAGATLSFLFFPMLVATAIGWASDRIGTRAILVLGAVFLFVENVANLKVDRLSWLIADNVIQGLGIISLLVGGQTALAQMTSGKTQARVMALWATTTGVGLALGSLLSGYFADKPVWRLCFVIEGATALSLAIAALLVLQPRPAAATAEARRGNIVELLGESQVLRLCLAFTLFTALNVGGGAAWPFYLSRVHDVPIGEIGRIAALAAPAAIAGSLVFGYLLSLSTKPRTIVLTYIGLALASTPLLYRAETDLQLVTLSMILWQFCVGAVNAFIYTMLPRVIIKKHNIGTATGALNNAAALASTGVVPLFFWIAALSQASVVFIALTVTCLVCSALAAPVWRLTGGVQPQPVQ